MGEGITGTVACELFGGPLDGAKYGDLPDMDGQLTGLVLSMPLAQPAETSPRGVYVCRGDAPVGGLWQFFYEHTEYPAAAEVVATTPKGA